MQLSTFIFPPLTYIAPPTLSIDEVPDKYPLDDVTFIDINDPPLDIVKVLPNF